MPASFGVWGLLKKHKSKSKTNFYELWAFGDPFGFVGEIRELKNHDEVHDNDVCWLGKDWNENDSFGGKKES